MNTLRVRIYNVRFGDAILITVPEKKGKRGRQLRNILIDVGNSASTSGGINALFEPVAENILAELKGQPLDLYIMTHEHMDHVQGLPFAEDRLLAKGAGSLKERLAVRYAWLSASADPDYRTRFPDSKEEKNLLGMMAEIEKMLQAAPGMAPSWVKGFLAINSTKTEECVNYLRSLTAHPSYVHREKDLTGLHPFVETRLALWAPEEDTSVYYGRFKPLAAMASALALAAEQEAESGVFPPAGVDASKFYNLVDMRQGGFADNLLAIDMAKNNTSVVLYLEWRGWRLLFTADAEQRSWKEMDKRGLLKEVDFIKVGHHGSQTATPPPDLLDKVLPKDGKQRFAAVSTYPAPDSPEDDFVYNDVPDAKTLDEIKTRAQVESTFGLADGGYLDYLFDGKKHTVTVKRSEG